MNGWDLTWLVMVGHGRLNEELGSHPVELHPVDVRISAYLAIGNIIMYLTHLSSRSRQTTVALL